MSALEALVFEPWSAPERPALRLVPPAAATSLARRRLHRQAVVQRRRRLLITVGVLLCVAVLSVPGHVFGAQTATGLPTDLATGSTLASGSVYVVQAGDSVRSISELIDPLNPGAASRLLVASLGSDVVVPGEHVLIP